MKTICISVDCSCHMGKVKEIRNILKYDVVDLLKFNFKVNGVILEDVFLKIYFDAEGVDGVYSDYLSISNHVMELTNRLLWARGYDLIVAAYTEQLPKELQPSGDVEALAELREKLTREETISIPRSMAEEILNFCDEIDHCEGVDRYPDFYYRLEKELNR